MKYKYENVLIEDLAATKEAFEDLGFHAHYSENTGKIDAFVKNSFGFCDSEKPRILFHIWEHGEKYELQLDRKNTVPGRNLLNTSQAIFALVRLTELGLIKTEKSYHDRVFKCCTACGQKIDIEDNFCSNCGIEFACCKNCENRNTELCGLAHLIHGSTYLSLVNDHDSCISHKWNKQHKVELLKEVKEQQHG